MVLKQRIEEPEEETEVVQEILRNQVRLRDSTPTARFPPLHPAAFASCIIRP